MSGADAARVIRGRCGDLAPRVGLVLGSGLGGLADDVAASCTIPYADLPGFPASTVPGHAGRLIVGRLGGTPVACLQGRAHVYEGLPPGALAVPIRTLRQIGCDALLLTSAAGTLRADFSPGSLMVLTDHLDLAGGSPLIGITDEPGGPRFLDLTRAYDPALRQRLREAAAAAGVTLHEGVYAWRAGPHFETPAEIRALRVLGADAVGMSTVPECLVARRCGMKVVAVSVITNLAAGMTGAPITHEETLVRAEAAARSLSRVIREFLRRLDQA